jgi:hypothetical protein
VLYFGNMRRNLKGIPVDMGHSRRAGGFLLAAVINGHPMAAIQDRFDDCRADKPRTADYQNVQREPISDRSARIMNRLS